MQFDIEIIANVVRALTNHPDIVDNQNFFTVLSLLEMASGADLYAHQPYDLNITNIIFEAYSNAQLKIAHAYKVRKALRDYMLLGVGMNIFYFQNSFNLKTNPKDIEFENSDSGYYISDVNKSQSLVGGVFNAR